MYNWAVRTLFEGRTARFVPWRARRQLEAAAFAACGLRDGTERLSVRPGTATATIAAMGDVALHSYGSGREERRARAGDALARILDGADLAVANLETVLTERTEKAGRLGSHLRAFPGAVEILERGGMGAVTCANNHCLDYGAAALAESADLVRSRGIDVCGVGSTPELARRPVVRSANGVRVGMLAYCDDWRPEAADGFLPAGSDDAHVLADVAALRPLVDVLVVQLHWGWEWSVHPLLDHRDRARRIAAAGADLVLCHHAHVPMAVEAHGSSVIAHGLGNFLFPWGARAGHLPEHVWRDRSYMLRVGVSAAGVHDARIVPVEFDDGRVTTSEGRPRREMLGGLAALCEALDDGRRLALLEHDRMAREGRDLARRLESLSSRGDEERLRESISFLRTPRGRTLADGLRALPDGSGVALADVVEGLIAGGGAAPVGVPAPARLHELARGLADSEYLSKDPPGRTP